MSLTAHCLVKNEENFVGYAIKSVIDYVDSIIVFDTGSTDKTVEIVKELASAYPDKIIFEEKGECDKKRHSELRQEMLDRTKTDWFMILDGDEVWTRRGMEEVQKVLAENQQVACILAPYYLCVGDIFHHSIRGKYQYGKTRTHALARFFRITRGVRWHPSAYAEGDHVEDERGDLIREGAYVILKNKYWHASALVRSSKDGDVLLGRHKQVVTYSLKIIGEGLPIYEKPPEVFADAKNFKLPLVKSWLNALLLILYGMKILKKRLWI